MYEDEATGLWHMLYPIAGFPFVLSGAESEDGVHWRPMDAADVDPGGQKLAPNHLLTVPNANCGGVYIDPVAADGRPFKLYPIQRGGAVADRARLDPDSPFHEFVKGKGAKNWMAEGVVAASADGLHWEMVDDASWGAPGWHPDPPPGCFYSDHLQKHVMVTRPGWGDRRLAMLTSDDALHWDDLQFLMQPDPTDPPGVQFYGMPVVPYECAYVGFLYLARFDNASRLARFNQLWGYVDCQLAYSFDGSHWQRGLREPFIPVNEPGAPGSGVVYPTCMIEAGDELRIYSASTRDLHHQYAATQFNPKGNIPPTAILLHTLRKDGFMYLASKGNWATFITKPIVFLKPELTVNVLAPHGEAVFQLTDLESRPLEGFTFDNCLALRECDELAAPIRWQGRSLEEVTNRVLRLEAKFRNARIHAFRGEFHFVDALDVALIDDGRPIRLGLFDW